MSNHISNLIVGQGLAGTTLAWRQYQQGQSFMVVDRGETVTASRVSGGLITPRIGRRMSQSVDFEVNWSEAVEFYRFAERLLNQPLLAKQSVLWLILTEDDEETAERRMAETVDGCLVWWQGRLQSQGPVRKGVWMKPAGRLDTKRYLDASRDFFERHDWYRQHDICLPNDLRLDGDVISVPELGLTADRIIFCQGAERNQWFYNVPNNPSRGDVITVKISDYTATDVVQHSIWLVPESDGCVTAGATYDWKHIDKKPRPEGQQELVNAIARMVSGNITVVDHKAAVRPTMTDYRPVVGRHPHDTRLYVLNGLGSRGVLTVPRLARLLSETIGTGDSKPLKKWWPNRFERESIRRPLTRIAQDRIAAVIEVGETVVDATVGNGFDTCFLAEQVGLWGSVYGFDIQKQAIESTQKRLEATGLENVTLLQKSHAQLSMYVPEPVAAAMFNLGYLPGGDHRVITRATTTIAALQQAFDRLRDNGRISVMVYRGHDGGVEEGAAVEYWLSNQCAGTVEKIESQPPRLSSPVLFVVTKEAN